MAISKVIYGETTLIDISEDTVNAAAMLSGVTAHKSNGEAITGNINTKTSADLSVSGSIVTVPSGYYAVAASAEVQTGSVTVSTLTSTVTPTISLNSSTGLITATNNTSISVGAALTSGYVVSVTSGTVYSKGSQTLQLTTKSAATYTPGTAAQTIAADQYLTGIQTIAGDTNLVAENIAENVTIFGVTGTHHAGPTIWRLVAQETLVYLDYASVNKKILTTAGSVRGTNLIL